MRLALSLFILCLVYCSAIEKNIKRDLVKVYYLYPEYQHSFIPVNQRQFSYRTTTITIETTSTSVITCTKSVFTPCPPGRKRRGILEVEDNEEQFPIIPTTVEKIEPTSKPSTIRDVRAADFDLYLMSPAFAYRPRSTLISGPYSYLPDTWPRGPNPNPLGFDPVFSRFSSLVNRLNLRTSTTTSTILTYSTQTSTPSCRKAGNLPLCT